MPFSVAATEIPCLTFWIFRDNLFGNYVYKYNVGKIKLVNIVFREA